jgi:quercetin dioxygenase-like cupin family protein
MSTLRNAVITLSATLIPLARAEQAPLAATEVLTKSHASWNGQLYESYPQGPPELTVLRITIPANTTLPWHTHPMPNATYILSGRITVEDRSSGQKRLIKAGEAFTEQVGTEHRGVTGDEPCVVIVTYSGTPGLATSVPAPGEKAPY